MKERKYSNLPTHLPKGQLAFNSASNELFVGNGDNKELMKVTDSILESSNVDYLGNEHKNVRDTQDANVEYILGEVNTVHYDGQHITATDTIEGRSKSAILKGQTLVNLIGDKREYDTAGTKLLYGWEFMLPYNLTSGKTYLAIFDVSGTIDTSNAKVYLMDNGFDSTTGNVESTIPSFSLGHNVVKCIATNNNHRVLRIRTTYNESKFTVSNVMFIEYQEGMENWNIPYFEGMQSVKMPVLTTTGKNLFDMNKPYDSITNNNATVIQNMDEIIVSSAESGTYVNAKFILDKNLLKGKTVTASCLYESDEKNIGTVQINYTNASGINSHKAFHKAPKTFTFPDELIGDITLCIYVNNTNIAQSNTVIVKNIQLEFGTISTSYEPYKSNILTVNEDVTLRGIGDVRDTLDCLIGEVTERIGEIVLDGVSEVVDGERWSTNTDLDTDVLKFFYITNKKINGLPVKTEGLLINDKFISKTISDRTNVRQTNTECLIGGDKTQGMIQVFIKKDRLTEISVNGFRQWLSQNPITVQYQLETESIKTVDLSDNHVYSYKDVTHYDCSSTEGSLVPTLSVDVPTNTSVVLAKQRVLISTLTAENSELKQEILKTNEERELNDLELLSNDFEMDFRIMNIELNLNVPTVLDLRSSRLRSPYDMAKALILGGKYDFEDMKYKLDVYLQYQKITQEEYDELISLMNQQVIV